MSQHCSGIMSQHCSGIMPQHCPKSAYIELKQHLGAISKYIYLSKISEPIRMSTGGIIAEASVLAIYEERNRQYFNLWHLEWEDYSEPKQQQFIKDLYYMLIEYFSEKDTRKKIQQTELIYKTLVNAIEKQDLYVGYTINNKI